MAIGFTHHLNIVPRTNGISQRQDKNQLLKSITCDVEIEQRWQELMYTKLF